MAENKTLLTVGFVGTGAITKAVVAGFCKRAGDTPFQIVLSPRNAKVAEALHKAWPDRITVAKTMQEVLDRSDWVVLAIPPAAGENVCRSLKFRREHKVISFLPDKTLPQLESWIGKTEVLVHMVPLTFNEICNGPILLYPPQAEAAELFGLIGHMVEVESAEAMSAFSGITACVTPFFAVMQTLIEWLAGQGVPAQQAADYVTHFFYSEAMEALPLDPAGVCRMARESTPGGINLMAKDLIEAGGGFEIWKKTMDEVLKRVAEAP